MSDAEDYKDSRNVLSWHYNEISVAFTSSKEKENLEKEFMKLMNDFTVCTCEVQQPPPSFLQGTSCFHVTR
jgi:hypothetical protein